MEQINILITAESGDPEVTVPDVVESLERTLPYIFDNVVVLSQVIEPGRTVDLEALGNLVRALLPTAVFEVDGDGQVLIYTGVDETGEPYDEVINPGSPLD